MKFIGVDFRRCGVAQAQFFYLIVFYSIFLFGTASAFFWAYGFHTGPTVRPQEQTTMNTQFDIETPALTTLDAAQRRRLNRSRRRAEGRGFRR